MGDSKVCVGVLILIFFVNDTISVGIIGEKYRWPQGILVYNYNGTFTFDELLAINTAMNEITRLTATTRIGIRIPCVTFRMSRPDDVDVVHLSNFKNRCSSQVGRRGGNQTLMLAASCFRSGKSWGTVAHELMHALGFHHEHSRKDRDNYVDILEDNIKKDKLQNFVKKNTATYSLPYDFASIMHYSDNAHSVDGNLKTIKARIRSGESLMGQRSTLSDTDVAKIRYMYNCSTDMCRI